MAREDVAELYRELRDSDFTFIPHGEHHLHDVYDQVKKRYAKLCDDRFLCGENCSSNHRQPEWQHAVRKVLWSKKSSTGSIRAGKGRGYWVFE